MHDLNRVELIGHLGQDPEVTYTATGIAHPVQCGDQPAVEGWGWPSAALWCDRYARARERSTGGGGGGA